MSSILKRHLAPLSETTWSMIDEQAASVLKGNLSARALVPFRGPLGLTAAAVNLGSVAAAGKSDFAGVEWGIRQVLPLVEAFAPFALSLEDLEQVERGGVTPDLQPVIAAALRLAMFEEGAVYNGLPQAGYAGLLGSSPHKPLNLPGTPDGFIKTIGQAVLTLQKHSVAGPYHLVLGTEAYQTLKLAEMQGRQASKFVGDLLLGGSIRWSPVFNASGALFSGRGGDSELTVGQDYAIGFAGTEDDTVNLFLMASFAFRVIEPAAAIALAMKA
ncbi:MAG: bacteriocin family protein [Lentisphaerae bacterium]|nr:bacteriocin family protein [Lentisphaerota bacterium]